MPHRGPRTLLLANMLLVGVCSTGVGCHSVPAPVPTADVSPLAAAPAERGTPSAATPSAPTAFSLAPRTGLVWRIDSAATGQEIMVGQSTVGPDGTLVLGPYGSVQVAGLTIEQARNQVEQHLAPYIRQPHVTLNTAAYTSIQKPPAEASAVATQRPQPAAPPNSVAASAKPNASTAPTPNSKPVVTAARPTNSSPYSGGTASANAVGRSASPYGRVPQQTVAKVSTSPAKPVDGVIVIAAAPAVKDVGVVQTADWQPVASEPAAATPTNSTYRPRPATSVPPPAQGSQWNGLQHGSVSGLVAVSWQPTETPPLTPPPANALPASALPLTSVASEPAEAIQVLPKQMPTTPQTPSAPPSVVAMVEPPPTEMVAPHHQAIPHECARVSLPPYVIDPPDILLIEATGVLPDQPIAGVHLVRPDGTVSLGIYGSVYVAGMTLDGAREAIRAQIGLRAKAFADNVKSLPKDLLDKMTPEERARVEYNPKYVNLSVDVAAYNSKYYYVISDGGGLGQQVTRHPITGNETILDAVSLVGGLTPVSSKHKIWLARPCGNDGHPHLYSVDWKAVAMCAGPNTNYQLLPGDRVYIDSQGLVKADTALARLFSPAERLLGVVLLGSSTVNSIKNSNGNGR